MTVAIFAPSVAYDRVRSEESGTQNSLSTCTRFIVVACYDGSIKVFENINQEQVELEEK